MAQLSTFAPARPEEILLPARPWFVVLTLFCLLATSTFLYLEVYAAFAPARASARLARLRTWLDTHQDQVIVAVCLLWACG